MTKNLPSKFFYFYDVSHYRLTKTKKLIPVNGPAVAHTAVQRVHGGEAGDGVMCRGSQRAPNASAAAICGLLAMTSSVCSFVTFLRLSLSVDLMTGTPK